MYSPLYAFKKNSSAIHKQLFLKAHANGRNKCQQLPTLLGVVGQQCCVRLCGPKSLTGFKQYATRANIVVVPCKWTQQATTLLGPTMLGVVGQQCWVRLNGPLIVCHSHWSIPRPREIVGCQNCRTFCVIKYYVYY